MTCILRQYLYTSIPCAATRNASSQSHPIICKQSFPKCYIYNATSNTNLNKLQLHFVKSKSNPIKSQHRFSKLQANRSTSKSKKCKMKCKK